MHMSTSLPTKPAVHMQNAALLRRACKLRPFDSAAEKTLDGCLVLSADL